MPAARKLTLDYCQAVGIALLQSEWGPIIKHPTRLIWSKFSKLDHTTRTCTMILFTPFCAPGILRTEDHMEKHAGHRMLDPRSKLHW